MGASRLRSRSHCCVLGIRAAKLRSAYAAGIFRTPGLGPASVVQVLTSGAAIATFFFVAIGFVGLLVLSRVPVDGHYAANVLIGVLPLSLGLGLTFLPITLIATNRLEAPDAGLASGILDTAQQMGATVGLAVLSTLAASRTLHGQQAPAPFKSAAFTLPSTELQPFLVRRC
jgi:hypothetical protein